LLNKLFPNIYEGWIIVIASGFVMMLSGSTFFYGLSAIFTSLLIDFNWSVASTSLAFSLRTEVQGLTGPIIGLSIDKLGPRFTIIVGILIAGLALFALSFITNLFQFYVVMLISALGIGAAGGQVGMAAVATWFDKKRSRALSIMTVGGGISGALVFFVAWLVELYGWRTAVQILSIYYIIIGLFFALNIRSRPQDHHQPMDGIPKMHFEEEENQILGMSSKDALKTRGFWSIAFGTSFCLFAGVPIILLTIPFLESLGYSKTLASIAMIAFTVSTVVGRLGSGYLADKYGNKLILTIGYFLVSIGTIGLFFANDIYVTMIFLFICGPGFGASIPIRASIIAEYFGTINFGTINGFCVFVSTLGAVIGPWIVGKMVDVTGDYSYGWLVAGLAAFLAVPTLIFAEKPSQMIK
tara:strand:+ start:22 stop:1254 length:1233 start_codon:yes stop_codon:yes gene_type:complete